MYLLGLAILLSNVVLCNNRYGKIIQISWMISIGSFFLLPLEYSDVYSIESKLTLLLFVLSFSLGLRGVEVREFSIQKTVLERNVLWIIMTPLILIAIGDIVFNIGNLSTIGSLSIAEFYSVESKSDVSLWSFMTALADANSFVTIMYWIHNKLNKRRILPFVYKVYFYVSSVHIILGTVLAGKRSMILYVIIAFVLLRLILRSSLVFNGFNFNQLWRIIRNGLGIASIGYFLFGVFPLLRNPHLASALTNYVDDVADRGFAPFVADNIDVPFYQSLGILSIGASYLHIGFVKYLYFYDKGLSQIKGYGFYNFSLVEKIFTGKLTTYSRVSDKLMYYGTSDGYNANPWSTFFRDITIDFSLVGGVVFTFVFARLLRLRLNKLKIKGDLLSYVEASILLLMIFLIPFTSPIRISFIFQSFILIRIYKVVIKSLGND